MKRKILIGLGFMTGIFFLGTVYIVYRIETAASRLNDMITLHQVEILRGSYVLQVKRVQADLLLQDTRHSRSFETFVKDALRMGDVIEACFGCHHHPHVVRRIEALQHRTREYENALSRVLTIRADAARLAREEESAFRIGEELIREAEGMIEMTGAKLAATTETALREVAGTRAILYVLIGISPLLSGTLAFVLIKGLTNPVEVLLDSTRRLQKGDLDHRVVGLKYEFAELAASFNEMARSLKDQMQKMQRAEQMAVVAQLAAGLAHEIKNPLAGMKVAVRVLSDEADLSEADRAVLDRVTGEIGRLESLMRNFLNFAKPPKPNPSPVDVNGLLETTLALCFDPEAGRPEPENGIRVLKDLGPLPPVMADHTLLQQVFLNVLLNAAEAMPEGGTLSIRTDAGEEPGSVRIVFSDTGKGIGEEGIERIFEPFFTTKAKGTGLGLAISKQIVERHGGTILAANNPGDGAAFTILLPGSPADGKAEP